jgi:hypothetical protein
VGGLVGSSYGSLTYCYSSGAVTGTDNVGGLVGENGNRGGYISSSYSSASVTGHLCVGGLVGINDGGGGSLCTIANSYSTGAVRSTGLYAGGLVGTNCGEITACYSTGLVSGMTDVGGLIGNDCRYDMMGGEGDAGGCFWDTQTSGQAASDGGTGKTTAEMQTARTFLDAGWDFVGETANGTEDLWWILEGKDYPRLWWEQGDEASPF